MISKFLVTLVVAIVALASTACSDGDSATDGGGNSADGSGQGDSSADASGQDTGVANDASDGGDAAVAPDPESLRVLNYNVMCSFCKNSDHPDWEQKWAARVPWLRDVLARHDADIIGTQELQAFGLKEGDPDEFEQLLPPGYDNYYYRTKAGDTLDIDYPDAATAWRTSRFTGLESGEFWLSPTPDKAFSSGFGKGAQLPRLVVWVRLHDKLSDRDVIVVNTHFDNNSPSQEKSAPLFLERLAPLAVKAPLIIVGDFNSRPNSVAYAKLVGGEPKLTDTYNEAVDKLDATPENVVLTNVTPAPFWDVKDRIDHIYFNGGFSVQRWKVDLYRYGDKVQAPSDHPGAVVVDLHWPKP